VRAWLARRLPAAKGEWRRRMELLETALRRKNLQLDAALNNMSQGLAVFDAQQSIVVTNARYAQMYGLTPEQVKPGTSLRRILLDRAANGAYANIDFAKRSRTSGTTSSRSSGLPTGASSPWCASRCRTAE
jgi:PAS domain-containing protein